jgi:hypothetical protein
MTETKDIPSLTNAAEEIARLFGKRVPSGLADWTREVDARVREKVREKTDDKTEATGEPIGRVAVTKVRSLLEGDLAYIRHQWTRVEMVRTATADPTRRIVIGSAVGTFEGARDRSWSEPADGLVIIRKRR